MEQNLIKKVFIFLPSFGGGGAEKVVTSLVNNWNEKCDITIFVLNDDGPNRKNINDDIAIVVLKQKKIYLSIFELAYFIAREKPDVLFTTLIYPISFISLLIPFFKRNTKFICRLSNIPSYELQEVKSWLVKKLYLSAIQRYHAIICQSKDMLEDLSIKINRANQAKLYKINNPIFFQPQLLDKQISRKKFVLIGRLSKQKNIALAIRAAHSADVYLDIYGIGEEEEKLQNLIQQLGTDKVKLCGFTNEVEKVILNSRALVLSSDYEGFPNILVESISLGVPVIARSCPGGINEIVNNDNGITFFNESELIDIFKNFNPEVYDGDVMINDIKRRFALTTISKKYLELFELL